MADTKRDEDTDSIVRERPTVSTPRMYAIIMHNDDYTPQDFVVEMLVQHCDKPVGEAVSIMLDVHKKGTGIAGIYTREIAETKVTRIMDDSAKAGHVFRVTFEPQGVN